MAKLKPGDRVSCHIDANVIVNPYVAYDDVRIFEIVSVDKNGYYLFVPSYYLIKKTIVATEYQCKQLKIDRRFLNDEIVYVAENLVAGVHSVMDGKCCSICGEFYQYATGNQPDGTLICFSCRENPYR